MPLTRTLSSIETIASRIAFKRTLSAPSSAAASCSSSRSEGLVLSSEDAPRDEKEHPTPRSEGVQERLLTLSRRFSDSHVLSHAHSLQAIQSFFRCDRESTAPPFSPTAPAPQAETTRQVLSLLHFLLARVLERESFLSTRPIPAVQSMESVATAIYCSPSPSAAQGEGEGEGEMSPSAPVLLAALVVTTHPLTRRSEQFFDLLQRVRVYCEARFPFGVFTDGRQFQLYWLPDEALSLSVSRSLSLSPCTPCEGERLRETERETDREKESRSASLGSSASARERDKQRDTERENDEDNDSSSDGERDSERETDKERDRERERERERESEDSLRLSECVVLREGALSLWDEPQREIEREIERQTERERERERDAEQWLDRAANARVAQRERERDRERALCSAPLSAILQGRALSALLCASLCIALSENALSLLPSLSASLSVPHRERQTERGRERLLAVKRDALRWVSLSRSSLSLSLQPPASLAALRRESLLLLRDLGGGSDGRVWLACTASSGRLVVLKFLAATRSANATSSRRPSAAAALAAAALAATTGGGHATKAANAHSASGGGHAASGGGKRLSAAAAAIERARAEAQRWRDVGLCAWKLNLLGCAVVAMPFGVTLSLVRERDALALRFVVQRSEIDRETLCVSRERETERDGEENTALTIRGFAVKHLREFETLCAAQDAQGALRDAVQRFASRRLVHDDVEWRHVALFPKFRRPSLSLSLPLSLSSAFSLSSSNRERVRDREREKEKDKEREREGDGEGESASRRERSSSFSLSLSAFWKERELSLSAPRASFLDLTRVHKVDTEAEAHFLMMHRVQTLLLPQLGGGEGPRDTALRA